MTVASADDWRRMRVVEPFHERTVHGPTGTTFGVSFCGYDVRLDQDVHLWPHSFVLASTLERFSVPPGWVGVVHDKSSWARLGLAVQNTVIEPGWRGHLTLELSRNDPTGGLMTLVAGTPIAQVLLHRVGRPWWAPWRRPASYEGRYQDQERGPQGARLARGEEEG